MKKREPSERKKMLKFIDQYNDKYDCIFIKITDFYDADNMGEVTDEQLREVCQNIYENSGYKPEKSPKQKNDERE